MLADASPEKRLFISLVTRDISMIAAFLDLIDNSINAAVEPMSDRLRTADDYQSVFADATISPSVDIRIKISSEKIEIKDTATGISAKTASEHVFKFGRSSDEVHAEDRLSVYGIGLKRAIFKLGNIINMTSDHVDGGFSMKLNVAKWAKLKQEKWSFDISERGNNPEETGTLIKITELYDDCKRRISDGVFKSQLHEAISRTYAFYLSKFVNIYINDEKVEGVGIDIGNNSSIDKFTEGDVSCVINAGIGMPKGGNFKDSGAGWFVFCNGRTVISADKSQLTGWALGPAGLPIFQPKHRPFLGMVFFVSADAEKLPWTTTKSGINEDSIIWQEAKRRMVSVGRQVVSFLDKRYTDDGTEIPSKDLHDAAGQKTSFIAAAAGEVRQFAPPTSPKPTTVKVQYSVEVADVDKIGDYLGKPGMPATKVGKYTFDFFLKNEVGDE